MGSAFQVGLYLRDFGATHRTDGLIAAFAVYTLVVVLGQLLRTTAVPLLSGSARCSMDSLRMGDRRHRCAGDDRMRQPQRAAG